MNGIRVGTVFGVPLKLHWSVVAIFGLVTWSLAAAVYPDLASGYPAAVYWLAALVTASLFFASLLAHELSHSLVARGLGIDVREITLWLLGGVSMIDGEAHSPHDEMKIAIAGPLMSFAIGIGSLVVALGLVLVHAPALLIFGAVWLGTINIVLALFNLVPAAPLDGGRVLRAWLWHRNGDRLRAGIAAAHAGRTFGWVLGGLGFVEFLLGGIDGLWFVLLGWFLVTASAAEEQQMRLTRDLGGMRVRDLMTPAPITVAADATVADVIDEYVFRHHCSAFPLVDSSGAVRGLVTLRRIRAVPASARTTTPVSQVAWALSDVTVAQPDERVLDVLRRMGDGGDDRVLVMDDGHLVGIISPTDVTRAMQIAEAVRAS